MCDGLDVEVAEHGIRLPVTHKLNGILVNVGAQESGSSARVEAAGTEQERVNARQGSYFGGRVSKSVGDILRFDTVHGAIGKDSVDQCLPGSIVLLEVKDNLPEAFAGADLRVGGATMANLFAFTSYYILLVREGEGRSAMQFTSFKSFKGAVLVL